MKELISKYDKHLQQARSVFESTRHQYIHYVQRFLSENLIDAFQDKPTHLQSIELILYVIKQSEHHHVPVLKSFLIALRSFLGYIYNEKTV